MASDKARTYDPKTGEELNYGLTDIQLDQECRRLCALHGFSYRSALEFLHQDFNRKLHEKEYAEALKRELRENEIIEKRQKSTPEEDLEALANDIVKSGRNNFSDRDFPKIFVRLADEYERNGGDLEALQNLAKKTRYDYSKMCEELKTI